jgi:hypothetical protein
LVRGKGSGDADLFKHLCGVKAVFLSNFGDLVKAECTAFSTIYEYGFTG